LVLQLSLQSIAENFERVKRPSTKGLSQIAIAEGDLEFHATHGPEAF
jgi:hypothetical protein